MLEWLLEQGYDPLFPAASLEEKNSGDEDSAEHEMQTVMVVNRGADRRYVSRRSPGLPVGPRTGEDRTGSCVPAAFSV